MATDIEVGLPLTFDYEGFPQAEIRENVDCAGHFVDCASISIDCAFIVDGGALQSHPYRNSVRPWAHLWTGRRLVNSLALQHHEVGDFVDQPRRAVLPGQEVSNSERISVVGVHGGPCPGVISDGRAHGAS
ncbi:hypothetical protein [Gordonia sp. NPDC058843]|uniref:hypothetical protein n=1 Tax=Gordonia sp. NPDC058843 TaxID=3346648 RepID=UPI0036BC8598